MSELKAFNCVDSDVQEFCEPRLVYLKSDADKAIAEKDAEIRRLKRALYKACANWANIAIAYFYSHAAIEKWRKMKRKCIAKAEEYK